jgi:hypothetical protein
MVVTPPSVVGDHGEQFGKVFGFVRPRVLIGTRFGFFRPFQNFGFKFLKCHSILFWL